MEPAAAFRGLANGASSAAAHAARVAKLIYRFMTREGLPARNRRVANSNGANTFKNQGLTCGSGAPMSHNDPASHPAPQIEFSECAEFALWHVQAPVGQLAGVRWQFQTHITGTPRLGLTHRRRQRIAVGRIKFFGDMAIAEEERERSGPLTNRRDAAIEE